KRIRPVVQLGQQFWLADPGTDDPCAVQYVSPDQRQTVVLAYQVRGRVGRGARRLHLRGLDPGRRYRRVPIEAGTAGAGSTRAALRGAALPLFAGQPPEPHHVGDWLSEVQLWEAID